MKNIEADRLSELMDAIYYQPCASVVHFCENDPLLSTKLALYCEAKEYHYQLNTPHADFAAQIKENLAAIPNASAFRMPLERPKFRIGGKEYDYALITLPLQKDKRLPFLRKVHEIMRNHGKIVIFFEKGNKTEQTDWTANLEKALFVATSTIEDMFEHYDIILSTKMHGWGEAR